MTDVGTEGSSELYRSVGSLTGIYSSRSQRK